MKTFYFGEFFYLKEFLSLKMLFSFLCPLSLSSEHKIMCDFDPIILQSSKKITQKKIATNIWSRQSLHCKYSTTVSMM